MRMGRGLAVRQGLRGALEAWRLAGGRVGGGRRAGVQGPGDGPKPPTFHPPPP